MERATISRARQEQFSGIFSELKAGFAVSAEVDLSESLECRSRRSNSNGGEGGIRTHGNLTATPDFESGTFGLSVTSPRALTPTCLEESFQHGFAFRFQYFGKDLDFMRQEGVGGEIE